MFLKLFSSRPPSLIKEVHAAHKPNLFSGSISGSRWRHKSMAQTLDWVTDTNKAMELQKQAQLNLSQWNKKKISLPKSVEVLHKDWGVATLEATQKHGVPYSVLNMANSVFPGGAALEGGCAQEENMWHRSTCAQSLLDNTVYLDKDSKTFRYNETTRKLLEAKLKMTDEEREAVRKHRGETDSVVYKVLFNKEPRVCFRGPEVKLINSGFDDFTSNKSLPDSGLSYTFLPQSDIFPFYELRSAAPELSSEPHTLDPETLEHYRADVRQRIAAQLDTLILEGKRNVILGAWGCGEFKNDPKIVAPIYREEIEKRTHFFDHIVFPILNTGLHDNHGIFAQHLDGMKLGKTPVVDRSLSLM
ncbi:TPA: poly(ADP-ribose) glycohydrolase domain-containing protein [Legionella anisa]